MPRTSADERFWSKVAKGQGCWWWTAYRNRDGYGLFSQNGRTRVASRVAWEMSRGPIPVGLVVCHRCDNPSCVRPDHLFLGTHADNARDRDEKGRIARGTGHGRAKLTEADVAWIRRSYREGGVSQRHLAAEYGLAMNAVNKLVRGVTWSHVK